MFKTFGHTENGGIKMYKQSRIAVLLPNVSGGGAERVALSLIEGFLKRGHAVDLVLMKAHGEFLDLVPSEVRIVNLAADRMRSALLPLIRYLRRYRPAVLFANLYALTVLAIWARLFARCRETKLVTVDHNRLSMQYGDSPSLRISLRLSYPLADSRVAVSRGVAEDLAALSSMEVEDFRVIPNPIAPAMATERAVAEAAKLWPSGKKRVLAVGRLKKQKNYPLLLRALAKTDPSIALLILGDGDQRNELERLADELGIAGRVTLSGFVPDPAPFYHAADLFALSSDHEGFGNVIVEALSAGTPVVSTDCPSGPREILADGEFGRLVKCGDAAQLAKAICDELASEIDTRRLQVRAQTFSPDRAVERYLKLLCSSQQTGRFDQ